MRDNNNNKTGQNTQQPIRADQNQKPGQAGKTGQGMDKGSKQGQQPNRQDQGLGNKNNQNQNNQKNPNQHNQDNDRTTRR